MYMVTPVETVSRNFLALGVYDVILFAVFAALFYAVLRKTKMLGDSVITNGVIALGISFIVFGFPAISGGVSLLFNITAFITQASVLALLFLITFLIASFFYPNMPEILTKAFSHRTTLWVVLAVVFVMFITSGLVSVIWKAGTNGPAGSLSAFGGIPNNILIFVAGITIFMVFILIASSVVRAD